MAVSLATGMVRTRVAACSSTDGGLVEGSGSVVDVVCSGVVVMLLQRRLLPSSSSFFAVSRRTTLPR